MRAIDSDRATLVLAAEFFGRNAYIRVGCGNVVKLFTNGDAPQLVAVIPLGVLPYDIWASDDGSWPNPADHGMHVNMRPRSDQSCLSRLQ